MRRSWGLAAIVCVLAQGGASAAPPAAPAPAPAAGAPPPPGPSRCEQAVIDEAERVHARIHALAAAAAGTAPLDDAARRRLVDGVLDVVFDAPVTLNGIVPFRELRAARAELADGGHDADARALLARALAPLDAELTRVLMASPALWAGRCAQYPDWDQPAPSPGPRARRARHAVAAWARGALQRSDACVRLVARAGALPQARRWKLRHALARCAARMTAAAARCERDLLPLARAGGYPLARAEGDLFRLVSFGDAPLRADELAVLGARIAGALDTLRPPLSELPAAAHARHGLRMALTAADPGQRIDELDDAVRDLVDPCRPMRPQFSVRCVLMPEVCEVHPDRVDPPVE